MEDFRDRLLAVFALVLRLVLVLLLRPEFAGPVFLALVLPLAFLAMDPVFLAPIVLRRGDDFSGFVTDSAPGLAPWGERLRPSPVDLASWERRSE
jgi:hypothetical protein